MSKFRTTGKSLGDDGGKGNYTRRSKAGVAMSARRISVQLEVWSWANFREYPVVSS
jgi:hypothetical protein